MNIIEKYNRIRPKMRCNEYIVSAVLVVIPRIIMILTTAYPLRVTGDELYMFYLPAKLAGLDWSGCMKDYRYYGYGFNILCVPLFKLIHDPVILYRSILCIVALLQMVIPILCCYLLKKFYKSYNAITNTLISVACSYMVTVYATYMYNEHIYVICVWISFFILHQLLREKNDKKRKLLYSVALGVSLVFSLTIHQRAVTLVYAFLITYIVYLVLFRRGLAYVIPVIGIYSVGSFINDKVVAWNVAYLSSVTSHTNEVQNTTVNTSFSLSWFQDSDYMQAFIRTIVGNINALNIWTLGLWMLIIVIGIYLLSRYFKGEIEEDEKTLGVIVCFGIVCIGITIVGLATTWGWGICQAYVENDATADSLRGLVYRRYYACYCAPMFPAMISYMNNHKIACKKLFKYTLIGSILCLLYYLKRIIAPLLINAKVGLGALSAFSLVTFATEEISIKNYMLGILIISIISALIVITYKYCSINKMLMIILGTMIWQYMYTAYIGDGGLVIYNRSYSDAATKLIREFNENEVDCLIYVQSAYVPESKQNIIAQLQFMNMQNTLYEGIPSLDDDIGIEIAYRYQKENDVLVENGYMLYQLDDNEYAYVKGDAILGYMQKYTYLEQFEQ